MCTPLYISAPPSSDLSPLLGSLLITSRTLVNSMLEFHLTSLSDVITLLSYLFKHLRKQYYLAGE